MADISLQEGSGLIHRFRTWWLNRNTPEDVEPDFDVHLLGQDIRVTNLEVPIQVVLGNSGKKFHLYPNPSVKYNPSDASGKCRVAGLFSKAGTETTPADKKPVPPDRRNCFILFDPDQYFHDISGFLRLEAGETLILGRGNDMQERLFSYPEGVAQRHLSITHTGDALIFKDLHTDSGTHVSAMSNPRDRQRLAQRRQEKLARLRELYGGPLRPLPPLEALANLKQVNRILANEPRRPRDSRNRPGGLLILPDDQTPIIIGDLHAQVDNLIKILSENSFLDALENGKAYLLILGDSVHSEVDGEMDRFDASLLILDLICKLILRFPEQVFYIRGNHDGFSTDIRKAGIPQGLLWEKEIRKNRGVAFKEEMDLFHDNLPIVAMSRDFITCHAAPPKAKANRDLLINTHQYPGLIKDLIWNRLQRPNYPAGYTRGDVKRFRKALDKETDCHFIVAHNPLNQDASVWTDAGEIPNHHIVFSGRTTCMALFTRISGHLMPLVYPAEPLLKQINKLSVQP